MSQRNNVESERGTAFHTPKDPNRESGLRASLALLGAFCALFTSVSFVNAFGVFQEYYQINQLRGKTEFDISWLGSFSTFTLYAFSVPAGLLVDKVGPLVPLCIGSVCLLLGIFMTSLCTRYYQFFLAQALVLGIGFAFVFCPAAATIPRYFKKNRALAMGVTIAGSSTGGIIWPITLNNLLNHTSVGFGWSLRIVGFIMVPLLVITCLTIRRPLPTSRDAYSAQEQGIRENKTGPTNYVFEKDEIRHIPLLKNRTFLLLCLGLGLSYLGFFGPFFYVSSYSVSLGQSSSFSFYLISILNAASLVGRILPGFLADRYGAWNMIILAGLSSAVVAFCWTAATSVGGVVIWSLAYGFTSGAIMSLQAACATGLARVEEQGKAIGLVMGSVALTGLFGSPICGQLVNHYGYLATSLFTGASLIVGACVILVARLRLEKRILAAV